MATILTYDLCFQYEYALRHLYALLNLCERGYPTGRYGLAFSFVCYVFYSTTGCMSIRVIYRITVVSCSVSLKPDAYCPLFFFFLCSIQVAMDSVCPYNF